MIKVIQAYWENTDKFYRRKKIIGKPLTQR